MKRVRVLSTLHRFNITLKVEIFVRRNEIFIEATNEFFFLIFNLELFSCWDYIFFVLDFLTTAANQ